MLSTVLTAKAVLLIVENVSIFNELHSFIYFVINQKYNNRIQKFMIH